MINSQGQSIFIYVFVYLFICVFIHSYICLSRDLHADGHLISDLWNDQYLVPCDIIQLLTHVKVETWSAIEQLTTY